MSKRPRNLLHNEIQGSSDRLEYDDFMPNYSINRSSSEENIAEFDNEMDAITLQGLQQTIIVLMKCNNSWADVPKRPKKWIKVISLKD